MSSVPTSACFNRKCARRSSVPSRSSGRLLLRGEFGWTSVSNFDDLPVSLRFFAGGDRSVRGYGYNTLGPENESGEVIGGRYLATGSVEYDYRIAEQWGVALFYDIGNAANEIDWDLNPQDRVGIGGRWYSPVGPIRVDLAYALDRPGLAFRVHINMGPDL
ncbi:MAG: BamA/TamA family outer membrane protein [Candidatus Manganitrophus sp.]|nr:BamA/TamA family outer membrane protein [Candidatus Manganitrophus sp.]